MSNFPFMLPVLENGDLKNTDKIIEEPPVLRFPVQRCGTKVVLSFGTVADSV